MSAITNTLSFFKGGNFYLEAGTQTGITAADTIQSKVAGVKAVLAIRVGNGAFVATTVTENANGAGSTITFGTGPSSESLFVLIIGDRC